MANEINIIIAAQDKATATLNGTGRAIKDVGDKSDEAATKVFRLKDHTVALATVAATAGLTTRALVGVMDDSTRAANGLDAALIGLDSIAKAYHQDANKARQASQELASDGLMTVADAATSLKNLLASGFNLDQSITLLKRFKDSAAFGRQASLSFGDSIRSATEGIKNGNSILVDNAGVTKNLSQMLTEAGLSAQDLSKAASDGSVRQAIYNGILKETNAQVGDAAKLADTAAGKQAQWDAQVNVLQQRIGQSLQPALVSLLSIVTPMIEKVAAWVEKNPELASGILITVTAVTALTTGAALLGLAITGLGPVFTLFGATSVAAIGGVKLAWTGLSAMVASPLVMPAIVVTAAIAAIASVVDAYNNAKNALDSAASAIQKKTQISVDMIKNARARYDKGEIDYETFRKLVSIGARATGTNSDSGGYRLVGEHGPEIAYIPQGSRVTPAYQARQGVPTSGGVSVTIQNYNSYNERDDRKFFEDLGFALENAS